MKINNTKPNEDSFFFKVIAALTVIALVAVIVLVASNMTKQKDDPDTHADSTAASTTEPSTADPAITDAPVTDAPVTDAPATDGTTAEEPDTTKPEDTTKSEETTSPAVTTPGTTVDAPEVPSSITGVKSEAEMLSSHQGTMLSSTEDAGQEYVDDIIFLGDSTTYGLKAYKMLKDGKDTKQVWTPANGTLTLSRVNSDKIVYPETGEEITIAEAVKQAKPKMMVITLGVNGVSFLTEEAQFKTPYKQLIDSIKENSPDTKIILQSIFPVAKKYDTSSKIDNDKINRANGWIADLAKECGVKYLYTCIALMDEQGYLVEEYQNGDYLHLNSVGFTRELNYIRTHAYN